MKRGAAAWGLVAASVARAGDPVQPAVATGAGSFFSLVQVVLALVVVLGAIMLFAWFLRRLGPGRGTAGGMLKVVGGVMIGPKERLVVVEVGDTWLVVGVGASSVNLVHTMPKPAGATVATPPEHAFSRLIGQALKSRSPGT